MIIHITPFKKIILVNINKVAIIAVVLVKKFPADLDDIKLSIKDYDKNRFINHISKIELIKGDATKTIPQFLRKNKHLLISLLFLDFDIYKPTFIALKYFLPTSLSLILTFCICGLLHDFVIMLYRWELTLLFTPWFLIMGLWVVISDFVKLDYSKSLWINRAIINITSIGCCFIIAYQLRLF